jgi:hypothetical protein
MVLIAVEELIDCNPWHGLRFGNLNPVEEADIERYFVSDSYYDVFLSDKHLEVRRDGRFLLAANGPVEVRHVAFTDSPSAGSRVKFEVRASRAVNLRIGKAAPREYPQGLTKGEESL